MHMEFETEKKAKNKGFAKGVITGVFSTIIIGITALSIFINVMGNSLVLSPGADSKGSQTILSSEVQKKINELTGYINLYFYEEADTKALAEGLYSGLLEGLGDTYSQYYTANEYADLQISATQNYCGIGAAMLQDIDTMQVTVSHVYEGSPAEAAGLKDGDILVMVEDIEAISMELSELVTYIRGEEGTVVHLQVYREGESDYIELDVTRANIDLPTIEHKLLKDHIGYIQILDFGAPTHEQFMAAVEDLKQQGMEGMIIDVRDNPGGMVTAVTEILDSILPEGLTVYIQDKYGKRQEFFSDAENYMDLPMAVLVNGNSASASEILAGAIRDYEYGTLIGTNTYGKGIVQTVYPLDEGDAVKLTTAKYFTPNGENIHGTGIAPDIELEYEYQGEMTDTYDEMQDNQILKAIEVLESEL
ncbi:MAG: S41 family peptidase [Lachnospiraceae bacterium]|nr:S41 family peptidase [Lachnospiraceae bacterium]